MKSSSLQRSLAFSVLLFIVLFQFGCVPVLSLLLGVKQPEQKSIEEIRRFALKHQIPIEDCVLIREDSTAFSFAKRMNKTILFDRNGYALDFNQHYENKSCGGNILSFLRGLSPVTYNTRDSGMVYQNESRFWTSFDGLRAYQSPSNSDTFDYCLVHYWNSFSGRHENQKMIQNLMESVQSNPRIKVRFVLVNQDLREGINEQLFVERARAYGFQAESTK